MLNSRHLEYFFAVAETESFTKAAKLMHISQPALSKQVSALEQELQANLFVRAGRKVELTAAGRTLLKEGKRYLAQEDNLRRKVHDAAHREKTVQPPVTLGYTGAIEVFGLATLVQRFRTDNPNRQLNIRKMERDKLLAALANGQLDAGLLVTEGHEMNPLMECRNLYEDRLCVIAGADCRADGKPRLSMEELAAMPLVCCTGEPAVWNCFLSRCRENQLEPKVVAQCELSETALLMVRSGLGFTVLSEQVIMPSDLKRIPVVDAPSVFLSMVWMKENINQGVPLLARLAADVQWKGE